MFEIIPRRKGLKREGPTEQEVLVRVNPDEAPGSRERTPLNLGLVLDRSGSMSGTKMKLTIEAACRAVKLLKASDYLTVVTFEERVETIYSGSVEDPEGICNRIRQIEADGATDLFGGWSRAGEELLKRLRPQRLSRLVLLTDGEANRGLVDPSTINANVARQTELGIQTTTMGFGDGYNETLLREMAEAGGGNHAYIKDSEMLSTFFSEEMESLLATRGTFVRLKARTAPGVGLTWLADLNNDREGRVCLANLVAGEPLALMARLRVDGPTEQSLVDFELCWHSLESGEVETREQQFFLPLVDAQEWERLPTHSEVDALVAVARVHRLREQATLILRYRLAEVAVQWLHWALEVPHLPEEEKLVIQDLIQDIEARDFNATYKKMAMYSHGHGHGHARTKGHYAQQLRVQEKPRAKKRLPLGPGWRLFEPLPWTMPRWVAFEGMLRGHFYGERLVRGNRTPPGEGAVLSMTALDLVSLGYTSPLNLAQAMARAPVLHPTNSQQEFRRRLDSDDCEFLELGSESAGCAALKRMCPHLYTGGCERRDLLFLEAVLATAITHRDNLALTCSVGYVALLWELLIEPTVPAPEFYYNVFLRAIQGLETDQTYSCKASAGELKGWEGHLKDFLPLAFRHARMRGMSAEEAMKFWGMGPYLLEVVPSALYILELHGHEPDKALKIAAAQPFEAETLAMLVGAAMGAVHGSQPGWFLDEKYEKKLEVIGRERWNEPGMKFM